MKKAFLILLPIILLYLAIGIYFLDKQSFLCPIEYKGDFLIRSDARGDGIFGADRSGKRLHNGVDFLADIGTPVLAARSGIITAATKNNGMGNYITIRHLGGITTIYGHLSRIYVRHYQFVRQGQIIGSVGKTGNAKYRDIQPHLHFEIRKDNTPQDPLGYLK